MHKLANQTGKFLSVRNIISKIMKKVIAILAITKKKKKNSETIGLVTLSHLFCHVPLNCAARSVALQKGASNFNDDGDKTTTN